jgi:hypothetical protein
LLHKVLGRSGDDSLGRVFFLQICTFLKWSRGDSNPSLLGTVPKIPASER